MIAATAAADAASPLLQWPCFLSWPRPFVRDSLPQHASSEARGPLRKLRSFSAPLLSLSSLQIAS